MDSLHGLITETDSFNEQLKAKEVLLLKFEQENDLLKENNNALLQKITEYKEALTERDKIVHNLQSTLKKCLEERDFGATEAGSATLQIKQMEEYVAELRNEVQKLSHENRSYREKTKRHEKEALELKKQLKAIANQWSSKEKTFCEQEVEYQKNIKEWEHKYLEASSNEILFNEKISNKESQILSITAELETLQGEFQAKEEHCDELNTLNKELQEEIQRAKDLLCEKQVELEETDTKYKDSMNKMIQLEAEIETLNSKYSILYDEVSNEKTVTEAKVAELIHQNQCLQDSLSEREAQAADWQKKFELSELEIKKIEKEIVELTEGSLINENKYDQVMVELKNSRQVVSKQKLTIDELNTDLSSCKEQLSSSQNTITNLTQELKQSCEHLEDNKKQLVNMSDNIEQLTANLLAKDNEIIRKNTEYEEFKTAMVAEHSEQIESFKLKLDSSETECSELKKELNEAQSKFNSELLNKTEECKGLNEKLQEANAELEIIKEAIDAFEKDQEENNVLIETLTTKNKDMEQQLKERMLENENLLKKQNADNVEIENLKKEKDLINSRLVSKCSEFDDLKLEKDSLNLKLVTMMEEKDLLKSNNEELNSKLSDSELTIQAHVKAYNEKLVEYEEIHEKLQLLVKENDQLHIELQAKKDEVLHLSKTQPQSTIAVNTEDTKDSSVGDLLENNSSSENMYLKNEISNLQDQLGEAHKLIQAEKENSVAIQEDSNNCVAGLKSKISDLRFVIKSLDNENSVLKQCLQEKKALNDGVNESIQRNAELIAQLEELQLKCRQMECRVQERDCEVSELRRNLLNSLDLSSFCVSNEPDGEGGSIPAAANVGSEDFHQHSLLNTSELLKALELSTSAESRLRDSLQNTELLQSELNKTRNNVLILRDHLRESLYENIKLQSELLQSQHLRATLAAAYVTRTAAQHNVDEYLYDVESSSLQRALHVDAVGSDGRRDAASSMEFVRQRLQELVLEHQGADGDTEDCLLQQLQWSIAALVRHAALKTMCGDMLLDSAKVTALTVKAARSVVEQLTAQPDEEQEKETYDGTAAVEEGGKEDGGDDGGDASTGGCDEGSSSDAGVQDDTMEYVRLYKSLCLIGGAVPPAADDGISEQMSKCMDILQSNLQSLLRNDSAVQDGAGHTHPSSSHGSSADTNCHHHHQDMQKLLTHREIQQSIISQLTSACTQLLHYFSVAESMMPNTSKPGHSNVTSTGMDVFGNELSMTSSPLKYAAVTPNTSDHDVSNIEGIFMDDSLWQRVPSGIPQHDNEPTSLPSITTLVEAIDSGERLDINSAVISDSPDQVNIDNTHESIDTRKPNDNTNYSSKPSIEDRGTRIREKLTATYPNLMACLSGQWDLIEIDGLDKDVQELVISLQASAGMLKVFYHTHLFAKNVDTSKDCIEDCKDDAEVKEVQSQESDKENEEETGSSAVNKEKLEDENIITDMTVLKPKKTTDIDSEKRPEDELHELRNEITEVKSENHRLHGICAGLQSEKKKLQEELESLDKYAAFVAHEFKTLKQLTDAATSSEARLKSHAADTEQILGEEYSHYAERIRQLLQQNKSENHTGLTPRERQQETFLEGLLQDYDKLTCIAAQRVEDLRNQLQAADRRLNASQQFLFEQSGEREAEVEQFEDQINKLTEQLKDFTSTAEHNARLTRELESVENELQVQMKRMDELQDELTVTRDALKHEQNKTRELSAVLRNKEDSDVLTATREGETQEELVSLKQQLSEATQHLRSLQQQTSDSYDSGTSMPVQMAGESLCPLCCNRNKRCVSSTDSPRSDSNNRRPSLHEELLAETGAGGPSDPSVTGVSSVVEDETANTTAANTSLLGSVKRRLMSVTRHLEAVQYSSQGLGTVSEDGISSAEEDWGDYSGTEDVSSNSTHRLAGGGMTDSQPQDDASLLKMLEEKLLTTLEVITEATVKHTSDLKMTVASLQRELAEMAEERDKCLQMENEMREKVLVVQSELGALKEELKDKCIELMQINESSAADQERLMSSNEEMKAQVKAEVTSLRQELSKKEETVEKLAAQLEECRQALRSKLSVQDDEFNNMRAELEGVQTHNGELLEQSEAMKHHLEELKKELQSKSTELKKLKEVKNKMEKEINTLTDSLSRCRLDVDEAKSERDCLQSTLMDELKKVSSLQARLEDSKRSQPEHKTIEQMQSRVKQLLAGQEKSMEKLRIKDRQIAELSHCVEEKKKLLLAREETLEQLKRAGVSKSTDKNTITECKETQTSLSLPGLLLRGPTANSTGLGSCSAEVQESWDAGQHSMEVLRRMTVASPEPVMHQTLSKTPALEVVSPSPDAASNKRSDSPSLTLDTLPVTPAQSTTHTQLESDYRLAEEMLTTKEREIEDLTDEITDTVGPSQSQVLQLEDRITDLQLELEQLKQNLLEAQQSLEQTEEEKHKLQDELFNLHQKHDHIERAYDSLKQDNISIQNDRANVARLFDEARSVIAMKEQELSLKEQEMTDLRGELEASTQKAADLQARLTKRQSSYKELNGKLEKCKLDARQREQLEERVNSLKGALTEEKAKTKLLEGEHKKCLDRFQEWQNRLQSRNEKLCAVDKRVANAELNVGRLEGKVKKKERAISELHSELSKTSSELEELRQELRVKEARLQETLSTVAELSEELKSLKVSRSTHRAINDGGPSPSVTITEMSDSDREQSLLHNTTSMSLNWSHLSQSEVDKQVAKLLAKVQKEGAQMLEFTEFMFLKTKAEADALSVASNNEENDRLINSLKEQINLLKLEAQRKEISHKSTVRSQQQCLESQSQLCKILEDQLETRNSELAMLELKCRKSEEQVEQLKQQMSYEVSSRQSLQHELDNLKEDLRKKQMDNVMLSCEVHRANTNLHTEQQKNSQDNTLGKQLERQLMFEVERREELSQELERMKTELAMIKNNRDLTSDEDNITITAEATAAPSSSHRMPQFSLSSLASSVALNRRSDDDRLRATEEQLTLANRRLEEMTARLKEAERRDATRGAQEADAAAQLKNDVSVLRIQLQDKDKLVNRIQEHNRLLQTQFSELVKQMQEEASKHEKQVTALQEEVLRLRWAEHRVEELLSLQFRPMDPVEDVKARLRQTFSAYLHARSCKKSLVWQKNYLLSVIKKFEKTEIETVRRLHKMVHHSMLAGEFTSNSRVSCQLLTSNFKKLPPIVRFRVVVHTATVIWRLQWRVKTKKQTALYPFTSSYQTSESAVASHLRNRLSPMDVTSPVSHTSFPSPPPHLSSTPPLASNTSLPYKDQVSYSGSGASGATNNVSYKSAQPLLHPTATYPNQKTVASTESPSQTGMARLLGQMPAGIPVGVLPSASSCSANSFVPSNESRIPSVTAGHRSVIPASQSMSPHMGRPTTSGAGGSEGRALPQSYQLNLQSPPTKDTSTQKGVSKRHNRVAATRGNDPNSSKEQPRPSSSDCVERHDNISRTLGIPSNKKR